jgi:hypothetical protein
MPNKCAEKLFKKIGKKSKTCFFCDCLLLFVSAAPCHRGLGRGTRTGGAARKPGVASAEKAKRSAATLDARRSCSCSCGLVAADLRLAIAACCH